MRVLVEAIDSHMKLVDLKITSNPDALLRNTPSLTPNPAPQPTKDAQAEQGVDTFSPPTWWSCHLKYFTYSFVYFYGHFVWFAYGHWDVVTTFALLYLMPILFRFYIHFGWFAYGNRAVVIEHFVLNMRTTLLMFAMMNGFY